MEVIPAIDLLGGKAVRLRQGRYEDVTVYDENPPLLASSWTGRVKRLHVVDLDGARDGQAAQYELVKRIVASFGAGVQVGGGLRTLDAVDRYFALGVDRVVLGTAAIKDPALVESAAKAYPRRIVVALDARNGIVATEAWRDASGRRAVDLARQLAALPIGPILYTDIERDGMEVGPNVEATARLAKDGGVAVIASGGVGTLDHLRVLADNPGIVGAIVGRALHERRFSLEQAVAAANP
jgi:phosphoribosylformimino-5-aminoimidazole carboxamide ribotide isomerase